MTQPACYFACCEDAVTAPRESATPGMPASAHTVVVRDAEKSTSREPKPARPTGEGTSTAQRTRSCHIDSAHNNMETAAVCAGSENMISRHLRLQTLENESAMVRARVLFASDSRIREELTDRAELADTPENGPRAQVIQHAAIPRLIADKTVLRRIALLERVTLELELQRGLRLLVLCLCMFAGELDYNFYTA